MLLCWQEHSRTPSHGPVCGSTDHPYPAESAGDAVAIEGCRGRGRRTPPEPSRPKPLARNAYQQLAAEAAELRGRAGDTADDPKGAAELADEATALLQAATDLAGRVEGLNETVTAHRDDATAAKEAAKQAALGRHRGLGALPRQPRTKRRPCEQASPRRSAASIQFAAIKAITPVETAIEALSTAEHDRMAAETTLRTTTAALAAQLAPSPFAIPDRARAALRSFEERDEIRQRVQDARHGAPQR